MAKKAGKFLRKEPSKESLLTRILKGAFGTVVLAVSVVEAAVLLSQMVFFLSNPETPVQTVSVDAEIMGKLDMYVTNQISDALDGILSVRKTYWLSDEDLVAPEPDAARFGEASDPAELQWLIDEAAELLDGQELYFSTETKIVPGSKIRYYLDDTILTINWKEVHDYSVYTCSEVKIAHPSQFRRFLAGGEYGSSKSFVTSEMAASVNAVTASSGDFYNFRNFGTRVYQGKVYRVDGKYADTCYIDDNGDLHFTYAGEMLTVEDAQEYVDEKNIRFSLAFGPVLVDNGERVKISKNYALGQVDEEYARAGLCQMDKLHYMLVVANSEGAYQGTHDIFTFAENLHDMGCIKAYALDGGQTAVITMKDEVINRVVYGTQRRISDIIYFATAIPDGG